MSKTFPKPQNAVTPEAVPVLPAAPINGHAPEANDHVPKSLNDPIIPNHPLARLAGKYADEPLWDDFQQAIQEYRQRVNQQEPQPVPSTIF